MRIARRIHTHWQRSPWLRRGLVSAALLGAVALWVEPQAILAEVQRFSAGWLVVALVISTLQVMLCAWRWQFTAGLIGVPLRFSYALREYYLALLVNQLLPGGVLGDAGRAHRHASQAQSRGRAWRAVIIERASGQVAVVLLSLSALLLSPLWYSVLGGAWIATVGLGSAAALAMAIAGGLLWRQRLNAWLGQLPNGYQALARDLKRGLLTRGVWLKQLLSSLLIVLSYGAVMVCAARAIGVALPALELLALTPVLLLAMLIPFSVAGWGLREGAAAGVWALVGLPSAQGVAVSLAYGVIVLLACLPGLGVALSRRRSAQPSGGQGSQAHIEQRVVTATEGARGRAQRTLKRLDGRHFEPRPAGADQQWRDQQVQPVNAARFDKLRNRDAATFDQHAGQAFVGQQGNDLAGLELAVFIQPQRAALNVARVRSLRHVGSHNMQRRGGVGTQQRQVMRHPPTRVQYHPGRIATANVAYGQLRVVGTGCPCADDHRVNQRAQAVQMDQAFITVDVVGVAAFRRNAAIHALAQLSDYPRRTTGEWRQAVQQFTRLSGDRLVRLPLAVKYLDGHGARVLMTHRQQPFPGVGQRNNVDMGVGHGASALKKPLYHAGPINSEQAYSAQARNVPHARKPGGLHVPD